MAAMKQDIIRALDALGVAETAARLRRQDVVLVYHSVEQEPSGFPHAVSVRSFAEQVRYLVDHYDVVMLDDLFSQPGARPRVAITFDDAYAELYEHVLPTVLECRAPVTVFVPTRFTQERTRLLADYGPGSDKEHLTWEQMREMQATGLVRFESHTHGHIDAVQNIDALDADLRRSIELLEGELGYRTRYFAYPYGNCNERTHTIALHCGFERVFTIESIPVRGGPVQGRIDIGRANERLEYFKLAVAGINTFTIRKQLGRLKRSTSG
jgi:peptidoglycan/xylan/chitin deacetylase (PgdA/CDA1 family)